MLVRVAKCDRGTARELLAIPAATEKVLVTHDLVISHHDAEAEDSQDALENELRRIQGTTSL